jgi:histone-binding protein RBBP4
MNNSIMDLIYHKKAGNVLDWSAVDQNLLASGAQDNRVFLWDLSKAGEEQARADYEVGPPELLFPHECHDYSIEAVSFSQSHLNYIASADNAGTMQVWKMRADVQESLSDLGEQIHDSDLED